VKFNIINNDNKLYVKWVSDEIGYGVFNKEKILKNEIIETCYSISVNHTFEDLKSFAFRSNTETDRLIPLGYGCIYNHNDDPNMRWEIKDDNRKIIQFIAIRDIQCDEELCHNYGPKYWEGKNKKMI